MGLWTRVSLQTYVPNVHLYIINPGQQLTVFQKTLKPLASNPDSLQGL